MFHWGALGLFFKAGKATVGSSGGVLLIQCSLPCMMKFCIEFLIRLELIPMLTIYFVRILYHLHGFRLQYVLVLEELVDLLLQES